jgi:hypothetical protein
LTVPAELAIGDGALGFWKVLEEEFGATRQQRCWVHKTMNVLNKLPQSTLPKAKADLKEIWQAESEDAEGLRPVPGQVRGQIRQGGRLPGQGSANPAGLLRFPCRALEAHPHR